MQKGFTLIELAIVLVIIGLLIGGILAGRSIISSAKVSKMVKELGQHEVAVNNFYTNYRYYPGDAPMFSPPGNATNDLLYAGNGNLTPCSAAEPGSANYEPRQSWFHLSQAGMVKEKYIKYTPEACTPGGHNDNYVIATSQVELTPLIKVQTASTYLNAVFPGVKKSPILIAKLSTIENLQFVFWQDPLEGLALERKLNVLETWITGPKRLGLVNNSGIGNCIARNLAIVPCTDPNAIAAAFNYAIGPQ